MILLIDTSQETGTVALSEEGQILFAEENKPAKDHAGWLHTAIARLLTQAGKSLRDLDAVSVIAGPGSYTGLRVAMASAKGFCYALKIPLITRNTLQVMAESMRSIAAEKGALICPMIDARREEVFTALYFDPVATANGQPASTSFQRAKPPTANGQLPTANPPSLTLRRAKPSTEFQDLQELLPPHALILDKNAFEGPLSRNPIIFFGSGSAKWEKTVESPMAIFYPQQSIMQAFARMSQEDFQSRNWADPVYAEPVYLKEFFSY